MIVRRSRPSRDRTTSRTGRTPRAWHDPALWAWVAVAVFALLPLSHVMASPASVTHAESSQDQASAGGGGTP